MKTPILLLSACAALSASAQTLRVNHVGYLTDDIKTAVYLGNTDPASMTFELTSPDHGTAYDIAGKGIASEASFRQAVYVAIDVFRNRQIDREIHANPLRKQYYDKRDDSDKLKLDAVEEDTL